VSCSYGQLDLCGFPKPHAFWYRANWLALRKSLGDGPPSAPDGIARLIDLLDQIETSTVNSTHESATINAVAFGATATLIIDGNDAGKQTIAVGEYPETVAPMVWEVVKPTGIKVLNATLLVSNSDGAEVARHELLGFGVSGPELTMELSLDVPSVTTGTGSALLLDGEDTAMVRATVKDLATGAMVSGQDVNITFEIASGPGRMAGVGNGNPIDHTLPKGQRVQTWGGLARAFVQVSVDATRDNRKLTKAMDVDGDARTTVVTGDCAAAGLDQVPITLRAVMVAASGGEVTQELQIPVSCSPEEDGWEAAAVASTKFSYIDDFEG